MSGAAFCCLGTSGRAPGGSLQDSAGPHAYSFCVRSPGGWGPLRTCIPAKLPADATAAGRGHTLALSRLLTICVTFTGDGPVALG